MGKYRLFVLSKDKEDSLAPPTWNESKEVNLGSIRNPNKNIVAVKLIWVN